MFCDVWCITCYSTLYIRNTCMKVCIIFAVRTNQKIMKKKIQKKKWMTTIMEMYYTDRPQWRTTSILKLCIVYCHDDLWSILTQCKHTYAHTRKYYSHEINQESPANIHDNSIILSRKLVLCVLLLDKQCMICMQNRSSNIQHNNKNNSNNKCGKRWKSTSQNIRFLKKTKYMCEYRAQQGKTIHYN